MPAALARPAKLRPKPGESQVSFYARAEKALRAKYNRVENRTAHVHELWIQGGGERELQAIARQKFTPDKFTRIASRPVFAEHTIRVPVRGADGKGGYRVEKYDRESLQQIADACNYRILDTGDFPPLTKGHTPSAEAAEQGAPQPDVLGYCGPFRLGLVGNKNPRWAIFQDEWVHNDDLPTVRKMSRRSPEVWSDAPMHERIIDPVAALGAETPRLDLGMSSFHFSRTASGRSVTKYSAAAFPAGGNTSPPSFGGPSKRRYAAGEDSMADMQAAASPQSNIDPGLVQAFVAAMMQTAPMQWVAQQMKASEQQADDGLGEQNVEPDGDEMPPESPADDLAPEMGDDVREPGLDEGMGDTGYGDEGFDDGGPVEEVDESAPAPEAAPEAEMAPAGEDDMDDEERTHYSAIPPQFRGSYLKARSAFRKRYEAGAGGGDPSMYSRAAGGTAAELATRCARLESDLETFRKNDRYSRRRNELDRLAREFVLDAKQEFAETCDLPAEQWDLHKNRIQSRYHRKPNPSAVPDLVIPGPKPAPVKARDKATTEDKYHRRAMDLINDRMRSRGAEPLSYDEAVQLAKGESKAAG